MTGTARATSWRTTLRERLLAITLALALCIGFMPPLAVAADEGDDITVTLTILAGSTTDYATGVTSFTTWVNKDYVMHADATLADLLDAAVSAGDLKAYSAPESSYGGKYVGSITSASGTELASWNSDDFSASLYWAYFQDSAYGQGDCAIDHVTLANDGIYQFAWDCFTSAHAPVWQEYYADNPVMVENDQVGLTITAGTSTDYSTNVTSTVTWLNKAYSLDDVRANAPAGTADANLTVQNVLDTAVAKGDIVSYFAPESSYGGKYIEAITTSTGTLKNWSNADGSLTEYWASYDNGSYFQGGDSAIDRAKITGGASYQFAWDSYTSAIAPADEATWQAFYADNPPTAAGQTPDDADGEEKQDDADDPSTTPEATGVDTAAIGTLMSNIATSYKGTSDSWQAMDLAALNRKGDVDREALLENCIALIKDPGMDTTAIQRSIIALSAMGYDATALPDGDGTLDAIAAMGKRISAATLLNARIAALWAYASGDYTAADDATMTVDQLIASVIADQLPDGGFALSGATANADVTGMAITALAPYANENADAKAAMDRALAALKTLQLADGGFADGDGIPNSCSTAFAIIGMCAAGVDPATQWVTDSGISPLQALLAYATPTKDGFAYEKDGDKDDLSTEQGFRALVAYQGLKSAIASQGEGATYDIYAQAREGSSSIPAADANPVTQKTDGPARTGFEEPGAAMLITAFALMLLAGAVQARLRSSRKLQ